MSRKGIARFNVTSNIEGLPGAALTAWHSFAAEYTSLLVEPGDAYVQYGENLEVRIQTAGRLTLENWLVFRQTDYEKGEETEWKEAKLVESPVGSRCFGHVFGSIRQPVTYYVRGLLRLDAQNGAGLDQVALVARDRTVAGPDPLHATYANRPASGVAITGPVIDSISMISSIPSLWMFS